MDKLIKYSKKYYWLIYVVFFLVIFMKHQSLELGINDDVWFIERSNTMPLFTYLEQRYLLWTSRIVIEAVMLTLFHFPSIVWMVLDSLLFVLILYSIATICNINNKKYGRMLLLPSMLILFIPFTYYGDAGWYATTLNYLWPLSLGLYVLVTIKKRFNNKKIYWYEHVVSFIALLFSTNQEQMCAIILGFLVVAIIVLYKRKHTVDKLFLGFLILSVGMLIFHLTCPGNANRSVIETTSWYPAFTTFTSIDKVVLGIITTTATFFTTPNIILDVFVMILPLLVWRKKGSVVDILLALVPLMAYVGVSKISTINNVFLRYTESMNRIPYDSLGFLAVFVFSIFFVSIVLYLIIKYSKEYTYLSSLIFLAGLASRVIIGFSPTIFASSIRTTIFLYYAMIFVIVILFKNSIKVHKD